jgi:glycosyltransferase involved in cell wall biosynthesis
MILHITNDYSGSSVYKNLFKELDSLSIAQIVYHPLRDIQRVNKNKIQLVTKGSEIIYSHILNKRLDRFFYKRKINKIVTDIERKVDLSKITFIHAHTWFSDGGVAYLLSLKYKIPYLIAIRNTDLSVHYKYLVHFHNFGFKILKNSKKIVLIGAYQKEFFKLKNLLDLKIENKLMIIPNGVDPYWIENSNNFKRKEVNLSFNFLYVGSFIERKNVYELQNAIIKLYKHHHINCKLHIVGGGGAKTELISNNIKDYPNLFEYYGKINNKTKLRRVYEKCHVFTMPSINETFGLVYIEALLQGLPVLYTKSQGIDGFYEERIGEKVKSNEVNEIKQRLLTLIENYNSYKIPTNNILRNHDWKNIATIYKNIYN